MAKQKPRLNRDGLPIDKNDWLPQDWQDLHEAIEKVKRNVARRHMNDDHEREAERNRPEQP